MKKILKMMIFLIAFLSLCYDIDAKKYSSSVMDAEKYLINQYDLKNTYSRYLLEIPTENNSHFYENYDNSELNFKYGGLLSEDEFNVTKRNKNNSYSYLYEVDGFWTLTKGDSSNKRKVISNITNDVNTEETFPKLKVTEYVQNTASVVGTGEYSDPWIFVPQYEVVLKVNNPEKGKLINPVYPYNEIDSIKMYVAPGGMKDIEILPKGVYQYLGNTCGHIINDASIRNKTENKLIVHEVTRDFECTINFGERPLQIGIDNDADDTNDEGIKKIYMLPNKAWYSDAQGQNHINVVNGLPSKDGYTTEGFYLEKNYTISHSGECSGKQYIDAAGNIKIKANSPENTIKTDTKLYPCYRPNKYTVTYNCNNGSSDTKTSEHIFSEDPVLIDNFCEKEGYKFIGWNTDTAGTGIRYLPGKQNGTNITDEASVTLYAQWEELIKFTATFDKNGANSLSDESVYCYTESAETGCKITTPTITPASGFTVIGFNESKTATTKTVGENEEIVLKSNKTYYAITKSSNKITVTFDKNGSGSTTTTKECYRYNGKDSCEIISPTPTPKSGYTIIGYSLNKDAVENQWTPNTGKLFSSNKTYYVLQSKNITATFDKNGASAIGTTSLSCTLYNADESCQVVTPSITPISGFNVVGWNTNNNATDKLVSQNAAANISTNTTYYAITNKEIVANFNHNGATSVGASNKKCYVYNGSTAGCKITAPTITGASLFTPVGWNTNQNATTSSWNVNAEKVMTSNTTYYAITKKTITITFDANGGSVSPTSASCYLYNGSTGTCSVTLPTATRSYSNFWGWNTASNASGTNYDAGKTYSSSKNTTLYANWELLHTLPIFTYTGTYQLVEDNDTVIYEGTNVKVVIPSEYSKYRGNWKIRFLSSGKITFHELRSAENGIDAFLVGGGGNGGGTYLKQAGRHGYSNGGGGGGGGYRTTKRGIGLTPTTYDISIGGARTKTTGFGQTANPGENGRANTTGSVGDCNNYGGAGGASGGQGGYNAVDGVAGSDGGCEFEECSTYSTRYGGGGGGGHSHNGRNSRGLRMPRGVSYPGAGGAGGGGQGNNQFWGTSNHNGQANTGGGGGGASFVFDRYDACGDTYLDYYDEEDCDCWSSDGCFNVSRTKSYSAGTGGSGIVIIRNKR